MNRKVKTTLVITLMLIVISCTYVPFLGDLMLSSEGASIIITRPVGYNYLWLYPPLKINKTYPNYKEESPSSWHRIYVNKDRIFIQIIAIIALGAIGVVIFWGRN